MGVLICETCGVTEEYDGQKPRRTECMKHHLQGLRFGFTHGKADFHGPTVRERQQRQVADAKEAGREIAPVGTRWV